jgi:cadmium resistance protein CadD (predicted permease)
MMSIGLAGQAVGLFAVTNIDDIVILALFFGRGTGRVGASRVVVGQCLGFAAILAVAVAGALGAGLLPETVIRTSGFFRWLLCLGTGSTPGQRNPEPSVPARRLTR